MENKMTPQINSLPDEIVSAVPHRASMLAQAKRVPAGTGIEVGPGQALCIPRGAVHRFDNNGTEDVTALCVITPAAIGPQYFRESAELVRAAAGGPPDRAKMMEIMRRHGLTPAPPPPQA